jgi:hypothetical protein
MADQITGWFSQQHFGRSHFRIQYKGRTKVVIADDALKKALSPKLLSIILLMSIRVVPTGRVY